MDLRCGWREENSAERGDLGFELGGSRDLGWRVCCDTYGQRRQRQIICDVYGLGISLELMLR